jgi:acyl-CoA thioester hydrolase
LEITEWRFEIAKAKNEADGMIRHKTEIRVRYADTDQMKVVYHGKYLEYFEVGRAALIRSLGLPYSELESRGILLPVIEAFAKFKKPAHYDDLLTVEAIVSELPKVTLKIDYQIFRNGEEEPLAEGYTVHSFLNVTTGKPTRPPSYFIQIIEKALTATVNSVGQN